MLLSTPSTFTYAPAGSEVTDTQPVGAGAVTIQIATAAASAAITIATVFSGICDHGIAFQRSRTPPPTRAWLTGGGAIGQSSSDWKASAASSFRGVFTATPSYGRRLRTPASGG